MEEEQNTLEAKDDKNQKNLEQDQKTLETGTAQETKDANKTVSSKNEKSKKKKKPQLTIESRNSSNGFNNKYRNISRTETNK
jgi:hypothetical protein